MLICTSRTAPASALVSMVGHCWPRLLQETLKHSQTSLLQSLVGSLLCSWTWCCWFLSVPSKTFCFPSPVESLVIKSCKGRFLGISSPLADPMVGDLMGLELSQQCNNFFGIIVLQLVGHPLSRYGIWFNVIAPLLPSHCGFSFYIYFVHNLLKTQSFTLCKWKLHCILIRKVQIH